MWLEVLLFALGLLVILAASAILFAAVHWRTATSRLRSRLNVAAIPLSPAIYNAHEIELLPPPVRRYFQAVLTDGQAIVSAAMFTQSGRFNSGEGQARWSRFAATQIAVTQRPGFDWDACISMAPGLRVLVHDAYVAGEGLLHAAVYGLIDVAKVQGTPELAHGELMRFLAEAAWYPTALLPSQGVRWQAIDDSSALATLSDGAITVSLVFSFDAEGLITEVRAESRPRTVSGKLVSAPWQGRFWNYEVRDGMRIPLEGEVAWELPEGLWPYWRGRITGMIYQFAK